MFQVLKTFFTYADRRYHSLVWDQHRTRQEKLSGGWSNPPSAPSGPSSPTWRPSKTSGAASGAKKMLKDLSRTNRLVSLSRSGRRFHSLKANTEDEEESLPRRPFGPLTRTPSTCLPGLASQTLKPPFSCCFPNRKLAAPYNNCTVLSLYTLSYNTRTLFALCELNSVIYRIKSKFIDKKRFSSIAQLKAFYNEKQKQTQKNQIKPKPTLQTCL